MYGIWKNMGKIITIRREEFGGFCYALLTALEKHSKRPSVTN